MRTGPKSDLQEATSDLEIEGQGHKTTSNRLVWGLIRLTASWTNLIGKVFLSIVTFDQQVGPHSGLADWSSRLSHLTGANDWYMNCNQFSRAVTGWSKTATWPLKRLLLVC